MADLVFFYQIGYKRVVELKSGYLWLFMGYLSAVLVTALSLIAVQLE